MISTNMELKSFLKDGVKYYQLFAPCPTCVELGHYITPQKWVCQKCRGDMYVGNNAHLYCPKCENDFKMIFAHFECPCCRQDGLESIIKFDCRIPHSYHALAVTGVWIGNDLNLLWIKNFIEELMKQP